MKASTLTTSKRPQTRTIVSSEITIKSNTSSDITVSAPFQDVAKLLVLTFSKHELIKMLDAINEHDRFMDILAGNKPSTPGPSNSDGSGSLV